MPKLKKNVDPLIRKAIDSLSLSIELFNRPSEVARSHSVLIMLQHSFEMLLKAAILQKTGIIHEKTGKYTFGFDKCLSIAHDDLKIITKDERATLSILDAQRDQAAHYYSEISEQILYVHAQTSATLFAELLEKSFKIRIADKLPERILPISVKPPKDIISLFSDEFKNIDEIISGNSRKAAAAAASLRSIVAFSAGSNGMAERISENEISKAIKRRKAGEEWDVILPEFSYLRLSTEGNGIPITMKITKDAPIAVRIAKPGEEVVGTMIKQVIDPWTVYNLSRDDIAKKIGLTGPKTHALMYEYDIFSNAEFYRELHHKSQTHKGYSKKALDFLKSIVGSVDIDSIWDKHKAKLGSSKSRKTK